VQTRVGPQRHRVGVRQRFPWPGTLVAGADAAAAEARAVQQRFEAEALALEARVSRAYWRLWLVRETARILQPQDEIDEALAELSRNRLELGSVSLADLQQVELRHTRLLDQLAGLEESEREAAVLLLAEVAAPADVEAPTTQEPPPPSQPRDSEATLRAALAEHPLLERWQIQSEAGELRTKEARNARGPAFSLGADWIEIGPAPDPSVAGSGRDAVSVSVGVELPLWQHNYAEDQRAAEAETAAARAEWLDARDRATAELGVALARLRDTARRVDLYEHTLIVQAEGALESTLGSYASGEGELAAILIAQSALVDLEMGLARARAEHAVAWSELERVVGRPVAAAVLAGEAAADPSEEGDEG
jgi:outer membrane protein TolC